MQALLTHYQIDYTDIDHSQEDDLDLGGIFK